MMNFNNNNRLHSRKFIAALLAAMMTVSLAGCGETGSAVKEESIELLNPVGVALNYEKAIKRNIYDYKLYASFVVPYEEEYELPETQYFESYSTYPGETVKRGGVLLHSSTESIDKQIEQLQESIKDMEEQFEEYIKETTESLVDPIKERDYYKDAMDKHLPKEPSEKTIDVTDPDTGETTKQPNPAYVDWQKNLDYVDGRYRSLYISIEQQEEAMRQRTAMYELDHAYNMTKLKRLKQDRAKYTLMSEMEGVVTSVKLMAGGDRMNGETPLVAVADVNRKEIKSDYINKGVVAKAEDVFAIINGKRYEVEYKAIDNDEYKRLEEQNGKVYSTFVLQGDTPEVELGSFASIIILNKKVENVLTVPKDSVKKDESTQYVYVVNGTDSVYTPVKTGMSDGVYTEIVSGLEEGAQVLTEKASAVTGKTTVQVAKGSMNYDFTSTGYMYYPSTQWVTNPVKYGTTYYVESQVNRYQQVKKGDVLATVKVVADQVTLDRQKQRLVRERERLADMIAKNPNNTDKNVEKMLAAKRESIADLEKLIAEMSSDFATKTIKSPVNGIVTDVQNHEADSILWPDAAICQIAEESRSYIFAVDDNGQLTYGNDVNVKYKGLDGQDHIVTGKVVTLNKMAASKVLTSDNKVSTGWQQSNAGALIMLSTEDAADIAASNVNENWWSRTRYDISASIRSMENVLIIPKKAVKETNGATYVNVKLANGEIEARAFVAGGSNNTYYWIVDGLTEGMEICLE